MTYDLLTGVLQVNSNGLVSFNNEIRSFSNELFPLDYPALSAFYANIDLRGSGQVYYRETADQRTLSQADRLIGRFYPKFQEQFRASSVFIATWYRVGYFKRMADKTNTFQVAIVSDGHETFVQFIYPEPIQWVQSSLADDLDLIDPRAVKAKAQAGFSAADGRIHMLRGSGNEQLHNLDRYDILCIV